jgi:iron complex outermembrane recepter protein
MSAVPRAFLSSIPSRLRAGSALFLLLLLAWALPGAAWAQGIGTVSGAVTHAGTGAPLSGVAVRVLGSTQTALTRADGTYRLQLPAGSHELQAGVVGFGMASATVRVTAGQSVVQNFALAPSALLLDEIVALGTRRLDRTITESPVPVDVIQAAVIQNTGLMETSQILQRLTPSVNFPRTSIADGTDHLRPVTLRGLAPDQVLVLLNGKRRHNTALVHVNGTVGRGSTSVDMNAIPANAIERIEILRDGAAAQYGSDAIAGVVNIVLKSGERREATAMIGSVFSSENGRDFRDGEMLNVNATVGALFRQGGHLTANLEFRDRNRTNRAYPDARPQYFANDARNSDPPRISSWQGDGDMRDIGAFLNAGLPLANGMEVYAFGGITQREGRAAGFFRRANDVRTVRSIHPNGFLPEIGSEILDYSGAAGVRGDVGGWRWDLSSVMGGNSFRFDVNNSNNVTLGAQSPTSFYAGTLGFTQWTSNLDLSRQLSLGLRAPLSIGIGAEFRLDGYSIEPGEADSYRDGGIRVLDGPSTGGQGALGAQVFPGFRPADQVDASRNSFAGYVDVENRLTSRLLVNVAGRVERFSDFGSTADGKVAARLELLDGVAVRGAAGTGFRAPSLAQSYFSATSTNFIVVNGVNTPFDIRTFPVGTQEAQILGAQALRAEESLNLSGGISLDVVPGLIITADYYAIDIDDRIVLSGNFTQPAVRQLFEQRGLRGVGGGRFFTNAIDTETRGFDIVGNYGLLLGDAGMVRAIAGYNRSRTRVARIAETPPELRQFQSTLFDRVEQGRIEKGQPKDNINLTLNYTLGGLGVNLHNQRFGEVTAFNADASGNLDQTFAAKWITDLDVSYQLMRRLRVAAGANNVLDVYPDAWKDFDQGVSGALTTNGIYRYPGGVSPFGFNGRTVYLKLSYR